VIARSWGFESLPGHQDKKPGTSTKDAPGFLLS
jgi:hypothetical protein